MCHSLIPSQDFVELFRAKKIFLLIVHHNPDGDALGASAGLALALLQAGKSVEVLLLGSWTERFDFVLEGFNVVREPSAIKEHDVTVLLDCHNLDRLGDDWPNVAEILKKLSSNPSMAVIDHHQLSSDENPTPYWFLETGASSTGELVWEVCSALNWELPQPALQALLLALVSDTGFFSQANTSSSCLRVCANLLDLGGNLNEISRRVRGELPLKKVKLLALGLDSLTIHCGGRVAVMFVTPAMAEEAGALISDTEDMVEWGRNIAGVTLSALIKDYGTGPGTLRVSLRSHFPVKARDLAVKFGGGGHLEASAYNDSTAKDVEEVVANLLSQVEDIL